jgi:hypothetical protein
MIGKRNNPQLSNAKHLQISGWFIPAVTFASSSVAGQSPTIPLEMQGSGPVTVFPARRCQVIPFDPGGAPYGKSIGWDFDIGDHLRGIPGPALGNKKTVNYGIAETTTLLILDRVTLLTFATNSTA